MKWWPPNTPRVMLRNIRAYLGPRSSYYQPIRGRMEMIPFCLFDEATASNKKTHEKSAEARGGASHTGARPSE